MTKAFRRSLRRRSGRSAPTSDFRTTTVVVRTHWPIAGCHEHGAVRGEDAGRSEFGSRACDGGSACRPDRRRHAPTYRARDFREASGTRSVEPDRRHNRCELTEPSGVGRARSLAAPVGDHAANPGRASEFAAFQGQLLKTVRAVRLGHHRFAASHGRHRCLCLAHIVGGVLFVVSLTKRAVQPPSKRSNSSMQRRRISSELY